MFTGHFLEETLITIITFTIIQCLMILLLLSEITVEVFIRSNYGVHYLYLMKFILIDAPKNL